MPFLSPTLSGKQATSGEAVGQRREVFAYYFLFAFDFNLPFTLPVPLSLLLL